MKRNMCTPIAAIFILAFITVIGCSSSSHDEGGEHDGNSELTSHLPGHEEDGGNGEESGQEFALDQTYDHVRNGARLKLVYDAQTNAFVGTVENTTNQTLSRVRVEVHLSNGIELGPTTPTDLGAGQKINIELKATAKSFKKWSAHPEVGSGEGGGEHGAGGGEGNEGGEHSEGREHD